MRRLAGLTLLLALLAPSLAADEAAEIAEHIANLGSPAWSVREKAQRRLVAIGEPAREKLRAALTHEDLEVRARASAALIEIGESFTYALKCARESQAGKQQHGQAALRALFRLDRSDALDRAAQDEFYRYGYSRRRDNALVLNVPPVLALASAEAMTNMPVLVSAAARPAWATLMQAANVMVDFSNGTDQVFMVSQQLNDMINRALGNQGGQSRARLVVVPMRIGQASFQFVCTLGQSTDPNAVAAAQLLGDFVEGGVGSVRAARLLAAGLVGDPTLVSRLHEEFLADPTSASLAAVVLCTDAKTDLLARATLTLAPQAAAMLQSRDWQSMEMAARFLAGQGEKERLAVLDPILAASNDSLALMAALWCARGLSVSAQARARVAACINNRQDGIASLAARWFVAAPSVSDDELGLVWKAAEAMPANSAFFRAALELIARDDVRPRLAVRAREALARNFETQLALAATVLRGMATAGDLALAVEKLWSAQNNALAGRLALLFDGASELPEATQSRLAEGLCDNDAPRRRRMMRALRQCSPQLRDALLTAAEARLAALNEKDAAALPKRLAKLALLGVRAGAGDAAALNSLLSTAQSNEGGEAGKQVLAELVKGAGGALVDALTPEGLSQTLATLKKGNSARYIEVATAAYFEQARRAVESDDSAAFRAAEARINSLYARSYNWQIMNELQMLAAELGPASDAGKPRPLPNMPRLNALTVDGK